MLVFKHKLFTSARIQLYVNLLTRKPFTGLVFDSGGYVSSKIHCAVSLVLSKTVFR